jgi:hypothetical protein
MRIQPIDGPAVRLPTVREQTENTCRHFTGLYRQKQCAAGVRYDAVVLDGSVPLRHPCHRVNLFRPEDVQPLPDCASRSWLTPEEVDAKVAESDARSAVFLRNIRRGICNECGESVHPKRRDGRCEYGACGHRIGQVG